MVMIGHSARLATPLSRRQSRTMAAVLACVFALVAGAIVFASVSSDQASSAHGCINVIVPSTMGAGQLHQCGVGARELCDSLVGKRDPMARLVLPECRRAGLASARPPAP
jgi:hypothetical protein